jgi:hypothetical protein
MNIGGGKSNLYQLVDKDSEGKGTFAPRRKLRFQPNVVIKSGQK